MARLMSRLAASAKAKLEAKTAAAGEKGLKAVAAAVAFAEKTKAKKAMKSMKKVIKPSKTAAAKKTKAFMSSAAGGKDGCVVPKSILKGSTPAKRPAATETVDSDEEGPEQPDMTFLDDPAKRRAAYGRLETAVKNAENKGVVAIYDHIRSGPNKSIKMRELLFDWLIDPTFGAAMLKNHTILEQIDEQKSKEEVVSYSRLEVLEGKQGAAELKDLLPQVIDGYGRTAYKYSRLMKLNGVCYIERGFLHIASDCPFARWGKLRCQGPPPVMSLG